MLLLTVDTSTPTVTAGVVSLLRPHELMTGRPVGDTSTVPEPITVLAERTVTDAFAHAEKLMPLVREALAAAGHGLPDLEAVVVGLGPGPFTGLRVGVATAQALGDALGAPVHGVGSHDGLARSHLRSERPTGDFLVVTDARRREVYLSAYSAAGARLFGPAPVAPAAAAEELRTAGVVPTSMIGPGVGLLADELPMARPSLTGDLSSGLVLAAARALLTGVVPGPLTPLYLRRPDAAEPGARKSVLGP
ncbi:tRNA threonylcarbamoyl adenosine modification protein YeaZ [Nakamurella sp. UYEF19]|uniref:tRNA (adenosine(37)-N6)-threonylcarbamoyltransferase complex dimerization subunit type 1 TsaB n=1 Tax=Nakamurella sp. UYEF19 TaxID=1756392 RepID=UPI0033932AA0